MSDQPPAVPALDPERAALLALVDPVQTTAWLRQLVRADSQNPPGREAAAAAVVARAMAGLGLEVELVEVAPGRPNVMARLPGRSPEELLLNGHLDTVGVGSPEAWRHDPWGGETVQGRLYGRGACDMKGGLAALMAAVAAVVGSGVERRRSILFTAVVDEEVDFLGTKALIAAGRLADCRRAYVAEPTALSLATSLQGAVEATAETRGRAAHSGLADQGRNAIFDMGQLVAALDSYRRWLAGRGAELGWSVDPSLNLGLIAGGQGVTIVPDRCRIGFDRQILPGESVDQVTAELAAVIDQARRRHDLDLTWRVEQSFSPWRIDPADPAVVSLADCHRAVTGQPASQSVFRAYAEIELLAQIGLPGLIYGPGSIVQAHGPDEFVPLDQVVTAARTYALAAYDFVSAPEIV
ncbi:MAG: ArgE/DapE family deacylase [Propionibacteriaceae bacterium]|jgi:acetylornithine deacetylase/succinyl-diaminopimelate desuccinylase family protein|nr:ArgE/DapE family deacylase [Propionibacteriaceae bacterium]